MAKRSLSSLKRLRQNKTRATRNLARKSQLKSTIRKVRDALAAHDVGATEKAFAEAVKVIDRSASRLTIHPNTAARRKSRLAKRLNALKAPAKK